MTARLRAVCALIRPCKRLADIGCDHGYVARYALDHGVETVVAADISAGALAKAERLLAPYGERATTVCADGLAAIGDDPDCIVLAGMGGHTILDILDGYTGNATLVLGPQRDVPAVRTYLTEHGYAIEADAVVEDRGRFYDVMRAARGHQRLQPLQRDYGVFYDRPNPALRQKLLWELARRVAYGADTADISEVLTWQQR